MKVGGREAAVASMPLVQFTRLGIPAEREWSLLAAWEASLRSCRAAHPELREVFLVRVEDGDWLEIAVWSQGADNDGASARVPPLDARAEFFDGVGELIGEESGLLISDQLNQTG